MSKGVWMGSFAKAKQVGIGCFAKAKRVGIACFAKAKQVDWQCSLTVALIALACNVLANSKDQYFSAMDIDQNGGISLPEFQSWMRYAFDRIDENKNDVIDADEALVPKMRGVTRAKHQANIAAQFRRQDADRDSALSLAELTAPPK
jgi:Ca2+-binding EF-hand superfamily protein